MACKSHNITQEMEGHNIDIMRLSKVRWLGNETIKIKDNTLYYRDNVTAGYLNGVGIMFNKKINKSVINFTPFS